MPYLATINQPTRPEDFAYHAEIFNPTPVWDALRDSFQQHFHTELTGEYHEYRLRCGIDPYDATDDDYIVLSWNRSHYSVPRYRRKTIPYMILHTNDLVLAVEMRLISFETNDA